MSLPPVVDTADRLPNPEPTRVLEDPRGIHPSPKSVLPDSSVSPEDRIPLKRKPTSAEDVRPPDADLGIVDPRYPSIGPEI